MATARREIRAHSDDGGLCAICGSAFPCPRAELAEFTLGSLAPAARSPQPRHHASAHCWTFPGTADQVRRARRLLADVLDGCPVADDVILCLSELATNAILHSASAMPGGTFTVRCEIRPGVCVHLRVADDGGSWQASADPDGRIHGLGIVAALAAKLSTHGDADTGRVVSARFDWPA